MRYLFVSPHPDDSEIALGGLINKLAMDQGEEVDILVCTGDGNLVMRHSGKEVPFSERKSEQRLAADVLGCQNVIFAELAPASKFDTVGLSSFVRCFDEHFPQYHGVFVPLPSYNQDHNMVWEAARATARQGVMDRVALFAYEQPFGTKQPEFGAVYHPLSASNMAAKRQAICTHQSQMAGRADSIYSADAAADFARYRGREIGEIYAEVTYLIRDVAGYRR